MNELSLFTGAGGGLVGTNLLGFHHIGYVENDNYCQRVLAQRIQDGFINEAPIFTDINEFIDSSAAAQYQGFTDVVTAGFPCQGWSACGKHAGIDDHRNMWPETRSVIGIVRPRFVYLENSTNIMSKGFIFQIIEDLSALGYVGRASRVSGLHVGAHSKRERAWIKAELSDTACRGLEGWHDVIEKWEAATRSIPPLRKDKIRMDLPDPGAFRADFGHPDRMERTRSIGNMQIPGVAAAAWRILG